MDPPSVGVVTPHYAQRGALGIVLPDSVTANTVEKYQGGERDMIAVSATVSDPGFARKEERSILNPRRPLVSQFFESAASRIERHLLKRIYQITAIEGDLSLFQLDHSPARNTRNSGYGGFLRQKFRFSRRRGIPQ